MLPTPSSLAIDWAASSSVVMALRLAKPAASRWPNVVKRRHLCERSVCSRAMSSPLRQEVLSLLLCGVCSGALVLGEEKMISTAKSCREDSSGFGEEVASRADGWVWSLWRCGGVPDDPSQGRSRRLARPSGHGFPLDASSLACLPPPQPFRSPRALPNVCLFIHVPIDRALAWPRSKSISYSAIARFRNVASTSAA